MHMLPDDAKVQDLLNRTGRILPRRTKDKNKLYTVYAPEVECISKGKARTPEFDTLTPFVAPDGMPGSYKSSTYMH